MELKALRSSVGNYGHIARHQVIKIDEKREAEKLLKTGLYKEYDRAAEEKAERERAEKVEASKALESTEHLEWLTIDEFERLRTAHADLTEQLNVKVEAIRDLREQIERKNEELLTIPGLNDQLAKANSVIKQHEETIGELVAKIAELSEPPAENETAPAKKPGTKKA